MPDALRVELLGPPRVWRGDQPVSLGSPRPTGLFTVLALRPGRPVPHDELVAALWEDTPPRGAAATLHTYVSGLRRALDPGRRRGADSPLATTPAGYVLRLDEDALDVAVFERACERGRGRHEAGDHREAAATLRAALDLWRGEPLAGVAGSFAEGNRTRLTELRLTAVENWAAAVLAGGGHAEVVAELTGLVREYPLREQLREPLMLALYRAGRQADALEVFADVRRTLDRELGVRPGPRLRRLRERVVARDPALDGRPADTEAPLSVLPGSVANALGRPGRAFVGRAAQVDRLREVVGEVAAGRGRAVWIEGEPGIGKSELLIEAFADAGHRGCQIAWGVADERRRGFPLQVFLDCFALDTGADPATVADRLLALVDRQCQRGPLVVVTDDLHHADEASLELWRRLCAAARQLPLLLVAATRPLPGDDRHARLRRGVDDHDGEVVLLGPLPESEVADLVRLAAGGAPGRRLAGLVARADGSPLFVAEMVASLVRSHGLVRRGAVVDLPESVEFDPPPSVLAAVRRRLAGLPERTLDVLRRAALLGVGFGVRDVAAVTGLGVAELVPVFEQAVAAGVIADGPDEPAFRHPALRQALYESIPEDQRPALHRLTARRLADAGAPVLRVAEQFAAASGDADDWLVTWLTRWHDPLANRAPAVALDLLERALRVCGQDDPRRERLELAHVRLLFRLDRLPVEAARAALERATEPDHVAETRHVLAASLYRRGRAGEAIAVITAAQDDPDVPDLWRVRDRHLLANFRRGGLDDLDGMRRQATEALRLAGDDDYLSAHAWQSLWLVHSVHRRHEEALAAVDNALARTRDSAELAGLRVDLLDNRMFTLQNLDRLDEAEESLQCARAVAAAHDLPSGLQVSAAVHHYWTGRWDQALAELDTVTEETSVITLNGLREPGPAALLLHGVAALIAARRGETGQAAAHLERAEDYGAASTSERESLDFLLAAQSLVAEQRGDLLEALRLLEPVLDPTYAQMMLRHQWLPGYVRLAMAAGDPSSAVRALVVCEEEAAKEVTPARAWAATLWCRGLIDGDPVPVLRAARHFRRAGRRLEFALAAEDAGGLLSGNGRTALSGAAFATAAQIFADLTARWDVERVQSRWGGRVRHAEGEGWAALTPLEVRIATLVAGGHSNPDIAGELVLPRRTVQAHVARVLDKLGTPSRAGVAGHVGRRST
ncbi:BTAD domain-containing putative transcriptional regulator [Amycolatopsis suaedae]|uniref:SARP family transcriptional regulator n=1 Tax=Amycolatopsis suaedae TaxID=2510978 RepID=A0A4Q7J093_9PSEU|nr:BTAD domain-containing putative transcriptional regulator [Amycolatopsis suaedae]RZQ60197.1 SARP family transcriptional regulator [Amycolatopsis suaedae]